jgi:sterol 3beta-glucosyltransferase
MIIHHGGSGTTSYALRSGVPSCVIPFVFDQFFWGQRAFELGVGPKPIPRSKLTVERLTRAIKSGIDDSEFREKAAAIGNKISKENGIQNAISIIENLSTRSNMDH